MDRATGFYPVGWGFESLQGRMQYEIRKHTYDRFDLYQVVTEEPWIDIELTEAEVEEYVDALKVVSIWNKILRERYEEKMKI